MVQIKMVQDVILLKKMEKICFVYIQKKILEIHKKFLLKKKKNQWKNSKKAKKIKKMNLSLNIKIR